MRPAPEVDEVSGEVVPEEAGRETEEEVGGDHRRHPEEDRRPELGGRLEGQPL